MTQTEASSSAVVAGVTPGQVPGSPGTVLLAMRAGWARSWQEKGISCWPA